MFTEKELAEYLKVSKVFLYRARKNGLPHIRVGNCIRYDLDEVMAWLLSNQERSFNA